MNLANVGLRHENINPSHRLKLFSYLTQPTVSNNKPMMNKALRSAWQEFQYMISQIVSRLGWAHEEQWFSTKS
ncbi:hypothetical protein [Calothrix sp. CCY 0018]|uniref:hypothetical protein n=1 Tax=Calothrix sp. CCY 0018 TaxID=3103864 RepID=UPI0039C72756